MPWRNGLGITREIAVHPPGTATDDPAFRWRLSIADIERDCEFSSFPGIARSIMLLEGRGMRLDLENGGALSLDAPFQPADFSGGIAAHCTLHDGPVRDFNIMSAEAHCRHSCEILNKFPYTLASMPADQTVAVCLYGGLEIFVNGESFRLDREDALLIPPQTAIHITAATQLACAAMIHFRELPELEVTSETKKSSTNQ